MTERTIRKAAMPAGISHYLTDYDAGRSGFTWEGARRALTGDTDARLNIAFEAVDRNVERGHGARLAARFIDRSWKRVDVTYTELQTRCNRFAGVLRSLGIEHDTNAVGPGSGPARPGPCVATLLGRVPELFTVGLGTLKSGNVFCSLFSAFGPEPLKTRLELGHVRVLVTTETLYRRKVAGIREMLPELRHVLIVREDVHTQLPAGTLDFEQLMRLSSETYEAAPTRDADVALLHFTSGTTGRPKGVTLTHAAVVAQHATSQLVLDLHPGEVYWCTADPGWVTGIAYGLIGPLTCAATMIVDREEFDPQRWYQVLAQECVNIWYTAPTAIRMLMKAGASLARARRYPCLRHMASVGEPLNAEAVIWGVEAFGMPFHDTWWQTETGAIMIANFAACDVPPGSMGRAVPGIEAQVVRRAGGRLEVIASPDEVGEIALRPGWPSMFSSYLESPERYRESFVDGWYLAGDLARRDREGYFWFIGRSDDVIKSAGHLISPFEVESTLMTHPAVAQAAVIGVPDPIAGQAVKAFVELRSGFEASEELRRKILGHARRLLGAVVAPREIAFSDSLPRTRSGKIMRRLLRARELGLPEGDLSTLEGRET
ncbi:MAG: acetate--CoA ligase [Gammaproteobacteria bacterium]|nr:acetate--CoA ligase [Gammaproteobacteria bacterium]MDE2264191.1 acetate--CoA ligase [Gammaproteobacteria bacterium]